VAEYVGCKSHEKQFVSAEVENAAWKWQWPQCDGKREMLKEAKMWRMLL
jgi:hypothetical protein